MTAENEGNGHGNGAHLPFEPSAGRFQDKKVAATNSRAKAAAPVSGSSTADWLYVLAVAMIMPPVRMKRLPTRTGRDGTCLNASHEMV